MNVVWWFLGSQSKNDFLSAETASKENWFSSSTMLWVSLLILLGALVRIRLFVANDSLWADEAALSLNIVGRSFGGLLQPLDNHQGAPVVFLMMEKVFTTFLGNREYALRLFPLIAGVVSLVLFYHVAKKCLNATAVPVGLALAAFSVSLVYFSNEVKPYSSDAACSLAIFLLTLIALEGKRAAFLALAMTGGLAVLLSYSAIFLLGGCGLVMVVTGWLRHQRVLVYRSLLVVAFWLATFATNYVLFLKSLPVNRYFLDYWMDRGFLSKSVVSWEGFQWLVITPFRIFLRATLGLGPWWVSVVVFGLGLVSLFKTRKTVIALVMIPTALTLLAAILQKYPFSGRLLLFLVPLYLLVVAAGVEFVCQCLPRQRIPIAVCMTLILLYSPLFSAVSSMIYHPEREGIKPVLKYISEQGRRGDLLYVYHGADVAFDFYSGYTQDYRGLDKLKIIKGIDRTSDASSYQKDLKQLDGYPRVWLLLSHAWNPDANVDEEKLFCSLLDGMGRCLLRMKEAQASAYMYDLSR